MNDNTIDASCSEVIITKDLKIRNFMGVSETYNQLLGTKEEIISSLGRATGCDITDVLAAVACGSMAA